MTRTIVFSKDQALHQIDGVPESAELQVLETGNGRDLLIIEGTKTLGLIRNIESFVDRGLVVGKLKQKDWVDG